MTEKRFIYTIKNGTMVIIDKKDNVVIRDKYRACDYLNRLNNENEQLKQLNIPVDKIKETVQDCKGRIVGIYYTDETMVK